MKWPWLYGSLNILWYCPSLGLEWILAFSSPLTTAEFSKFADILSAALSQRHWGKWSPTTCISPVSGFLYCTYFCTWQWPAAFTAVYYSTVCTYHGVLSVLLERHLGCLQVLAITNKVAMNICVQDCWWTQHSYLLHLLPGLLLAQENIRNSARRLSCYASTENAGWCNLDEDKARGSWSLRREDRKQDPFLGGQVGNWDHKRFQNLGHSLSTNWTENTCPGLDPPEPVSLGFLVKWGKRFLWTLLQPRPLPSVLLGLWWQNVRMSIRTLRVPDHFFPDCFIPVIQTGYFTFSPHIRWLFLSVLSVVLSNQSSELFTLFWVVIFFCPRISIWISFTSSFSLVRSSIPSFVPIVHNCSLRHFHECCLNISVR